MSPITAGDVDAGAKADRLVRYLKRLAHIGPREVRVLKERPKGDWLE